ncbi:DUF4232 domain-containing protein [Streptomyces sp. NPDC001514]
MQYRNSIRRAAAAMVVVSAATLLATGCQPTGDDSGAAAPSAAGKPSGAPSAAGSPAGTPNPAASEPGRTSVPPVNDPAESGSSGGSGEGAGSSGTAPTCAPTDLRAEGHQATDYPPGTGTGAEVVGFKNTSDRACTLEGFPTVAAAGMTRPDLNRPLAVTRTGSASPVRLAPGGTAWVKLTFVQVQGEADGYCVSGAEPQLYPTLIVGLPGAGRHQVQLEDGRDVAACDDKVTVTAVSGSKPS